MSVAILAQVLDLAILLHLFPWTGVALHLLMRRCIEVAHDAWKLLVHRGCLRTMMAQWFMMTKASKGKNVYQYSQEDEATQDIMFNDVKVLGCGHLNLGKYGYCGSCNKTLCWRCWQQCRDPVIRDLLLVKVCELTTTEWVNTCKVCSSTRPHDHCPYDCPGRIKYVTKIAMETLFAQTTFLPDKNVVLIVFLLFFLFHKEWSFCPQGFSGWICSQSYVSYWDRSLSRDWGSTE